MRAGPRSLLALFQKVDGGFLASRFGLFIPILVFSQILDTAAFGQFSSLYHAFLFAGNLALWGAHDALLVKQESTRGRVSQLALFYGLAVVLTGSSSYVLDPWGLLIATFVFLYRPLHLLLLTVFRDERDRYLFLTAGLLVASAALLLPFPTRFGRLGAATALMLGVQAVLLARRTDLLSVRPRLFFSRAVEEHGYAGNHILSGFFIQGSLYVFSLLAPEGPFVAATQFAYLLNVVLVVQGLLYRLAVHHFARGADGPKRDGFFLFARLALGVAVGAAVVVALWGSGIERLLFGRSAALPELGGYLVWVLVVHAMNYPLAGLLVGSGRVRAQLLVSALSAAVLVLALLLLPDRGSAGSFGLAMSITTFSAVLGRLVAAHTLLRKAS